MDSAESGVGTVTVASISLLDGIMLVALFAGAMLGYTRGLIRQLFSLAGWIAAMAAGFLFHDDVAPFIESFVPIETGALFGEYATLAEAADLDRYMYNALAFAAVFFGAKLVIWAVFLVLQSVASLPVLRTVNRLSGALLGLVQATVIVIIVLLVLDALPSERVRLLLEQSAGFLWLEQNKPSLLAWIGGLWQ